MIRVDGSEWRGLSPEQTAALVQRRLARQDDDWTPIERLPTLPVLDELLPTGLPRGAVVDYEGSLTVLLGILAATSKAGLSTAIVNLPSRPNSVAALLAAHEMGAELSRIAVVDAPESHVLEVINVLVDGLALVIADPGSAALPPSVAKILVNRAHKHECTLVLANGLRRCPGADLRMRARCVGIEGLGQGRGYLRSQRYAVEAKLKGGYQARAEFRHGGQFGRAGTEWTTVTPQADVITLPAQAG